MAVITSSLDSNFCPASDFLKFGNKKKVIQGEIWRIWWMGQQFLVQFGFGDGRGVSQCIFHGGRALFSLPNGAVFAAIRRQINPLIWHSRALWPFCTFPGSLCRSHLVNSRKWWTSSFWLIGHSLPSSEHVRLVKFTVSTVSWSLVYTRGSMFRRRSWNDTETPSDCV